MATWEDPELRSSLDIAYVWLLIGPFPLKS